MEPSSIFTLLLPLLSVTAAPHTALEPSETEPLAFGRVVEVITSRSRVEQLHANRLRLSDDISLGGVFNPFEPLENQTYTLNIRITF